MQICSDRARSHQRQMMNCPECQSDHIRKNGHRGDKQNHICVDCGRQFIENPQTERGYSDEVRGKLSQNVRQWYGVSGH